MSDYYSKYIKYKSLYLDIKREQIDKTRLTEDNTKIKKMKFVNEFNAKITDSDILDLLSSAYKVLLHKFVPNTAINGTAIVWKILYQDNKLVGMAVTTDLDQFKSASNFEDKGGIKDAKGLYITSVAGNSEYSGVINLLFNKIDNYARKHEYDYLLLEAKQYEPDYLPIVYGKKGFIKIKIMNDDEEISTLMCKNINPEFDCESTIKKNLAL